MIVRRILPCIGDLLVGELDFMGFPGVHEVYMRHQTNLNQNTCIFIDQTNPSTGHLCR